MGGTETNWQRPDGERMGEIKKEKNEWMAKNTLIKAKEMAVESWINREDKEEGGVCEGHKVVWFGWKRALKLSLQGHPLLVWTWRKEKQ